MTAWEQRVKRLRARVRDNLHAIWPEYPDSRIDTVLRNATVKQLRGLATVTRDELIRDGTIETTSFDVLMLDAK